MISKLESTFSLSRKCKSRKKKFLDKQSLKKTLPPTHTHRKQEEGCASPKRELTAQEDMGSRKWRAHYKKRSEGKLHQDNKQESQADKTHSRSREHRVQTGAGQNDPRDICQED